MEDKRTAYLVLLSLVETVTIRLRQGGYCAQLVSVSIRTKDFYSYSHQRKFYTPTDCTDTIHQIACELFDEVWGNQPIRHLGVRVSELCNNSLIQICIFEKDSEKQRAKDHAVDLIRSRFGSSSIFRAAFLHSGLGYMAGGTVADEEYPMSSLL